ncbi:MAG: DsbE family thiol:disulfide interchange protein [Rhodanobacteraceae bacterium]
MNSRLLPLAGFALLAALLGFGIWWNKHHEAREVPSPLIGKPAPAFNLPLLLHAGQTLDNQQLLGKPYLLNVFASWCATCQYEHPILTNDVKPLGIKLVGLDLKDDANDAKRWLAQFGNPYDIVIADQVGRVSIDFGIYGPPETFLIDAHGTIRYKRVGMFTPDLIADELIPEINRLRKESP